MQKLSLGCKAIQAEGKPKLIYEAHQSEEESWEISGEEMDIAIDMVIIKSFNFNTYSKSRQVS